MSTKPAVMVQTDRFKHRSVFSIVNSKIQRWCFQNCLESSLTHNLVTSSVSRQVLLDFLRASTEVTKSLPPLPTKMQKPTGLTASSITASFPIPVLTPIATITSPPTYATIRLAQTQLNSNATTVPSHEGDGIHGHLALTLKPAAYLLRSGGIPFIAPVNGPRQPVHPVPAGTAAQIAEINRVFYDNQATFRTYMETDKALRNQLIAAIPADYLRGLADPELGLGSVTCLTILSHLWDTWGAITQIELDANSLRMHTPWHPPTPIDKLFTQLDDGVRFATAGNDTPSAPSVVRLGYNLILATGLFDVPCRDWRAKPEAAKTLAQFIVHFRAADQDRRLTATTSTAGFHGANAACATTTRSIPAATPRTVTPPPTLPTAAIPTVSPRGPDLRPHTSYCWTHGHLKNPKHTSVTCNYKHADHQDAATATNTMGGSTAIFIPRPHT